MRILNAVGGFLRFWYEFVIGDDWTVAAAVAAALLLTAALNHAHVVSWWVVPVTVVLTVGLSLRRSSATSV